MPVDVEAVLAAAAGALGRAWLRADTEPLTGSLRSVVLRADGPGGPPVVIKAFDAEQTDEGLPREAAALSVLVGRGSPAPHLLARVDDPPLVVLTDLGSGPSLADLLRGDDRGAAEQGVVAWATALGRLHAGTRDAGPGFAAALADRSPDASRPIAADSTPAMVEDALRELDALLPRLGLTAAPAAVEALRGLPGQVGGPWALSPGDTCPDNNITTADGLVLLDFESATVRPVAWDLAYLRVPWPTCWCAWRLPDELADRALGAWRSELSPDESIEDDIARATVGWTILTTAWFLGRTLDGVATMGRGVRTGPARPALLTHRLGLLTGDVGDVDGVVARVAARDVPSLVDLAGQLRKALVARWGDAELPLPPALA